MYVPHRDPSPDWLAVLQGIAPMRDSASHLTIHWHAGLPSAPVGRWVIFECVPRDVAEMFGLLAQLEAQLEEAPTDPLLRWAHEYLTRTRTVPSPTWVVQGAQGGHPFKYTPAEDVLCRAGLLPAIPAIGELPYAEPDRRTWTALHQRGALARALPDAYAAREAARTAAQVTKRKADVERATAAVQADVDGGGLYDVLEHGTATVTREDARGTAADLSDEHLARYIETGILSPT